MGKLAIRDECEMNEMAFRVTSNDGTTIAYDRKGSGPAVVLVGGALDDGAENASLVPALAEHFTVYNYARRGRGASGFTEPYAVEREIEDLDALIAEAGGSAHLFGASSGGALALEAAAAGSADTVLEAAIEAGADDVTSDEGGHTIVCAFESLGTVASALEAAIGTPETVKAIWKPVTSTPLDEENAGTILKLIAALEDDDDVQAVFANFEIDDATMARLTAAA